MGVIKMYKNRESEVYLPTYYKKMIFFTVIDENS